MSDRAPRRGPRRSLAYDAGRAVAPHAARARWIWRSLTGSFEQQLAAEEAMGRHLLAAYRLQAPADDDPGVTRRLNALLHRLCQGLAARRRTFCVQSALDPVANAFALPGGFVLLTRPLYELCGADDSALAFVIAHEMGHVVRGHAIDRYLASTAAQAITRLVPARGPLTAALRTELSRLISRSYSRDQEFEADAYGARLLRAAGFPIDGAIRLLSALATLPGETDGGLPYFRSHPPIAARIAAITPR